MVDRKIFENTAQTGIQFLILRDTGKCSCIKKPLNNKYEDEDEKGQSLLGIGNTLLQKEELGKIVDDIELADPNCKECFGTGVKFFKILTNKLRYSNSTSTNAGDGGELERQDFKLLKDDMIFLYVPYYYNFLTLKDYVALVALDDENNIIKPIKILNIYKIININEYIDGDFKYYRLNLDKKKVI